MKVARTGLRWAALAVASCALAAGLTSQARADITILGPSVNLQALIDGQAPLQVGDKLFDNFGFLSVSGFLASEVLVTGIQDSYGYGLRFSGGWTAVGGEVKDFILSFDVAVAPQSNLLISDVHLRYNGTYLGEGYTEVVEDAYTMDDKLVGTIHAYNPPSNTNPDALLLAVPVNKLQIIKDVLLDGGTGHRLLSESRAQISYIDQTFSQIPEPSTVVMVVTGLVGLCLISRRSH